MEDKARLEDRIQALDEERISLNAKLLIIEQIELDKKQQQKDLADTYNQEIDELKEVLEKKEYMLQFNEEKYAQYEKVLRDLILSYDTPDPVKDQLRIKIENQELCVPKDERKISNVVNENKELNEQVMMLKKENTTMRTQLEEILERGQLARQQATQENQNTFLNNFMNQTIEVLSIFQNKEMAQFRNIDVASIKKDQ